MQKGLFLYLLQARQQKLLDPLKWRVGRVINIYHPHEVTSPGVAVAILLLGIALESWSFRTAIVAAQPVRGSKSWWSFIRRSKSPELPVVLLEDLGALLGLLIALVGVGLSAVFDDPRFDAVGSVAIGALLGVIAIVLAIEMKSLLIGESATTEIQGAIQTTIERSHSVRKLIHMRTLHLGPDELLVAVKVEFDASLDIPGLALAIDDLESAIRQQTPSAQVIYVEPDVVRSAPA